MCTVIELGGGITLYLCHKHHIRNVGLTKSCLFFLSFFLPPFFFLSFIFLGCCAASPSQYCQFLTSFFGTFQWKIRKVKPWMEYYLKGQCHEINNCLKVLKIKSILSVYEPVVFDFFCILPVKKITFQVLA